MDFHPLTRYHLHVQSSKVIDTTGVVAMGSLHDAALQMSLSVAPASKAMHAIATRFTEAFRDPMVRAEIALLRLRARAQDALNGLTTRLGREYLDTLPDSVTDSVMRLVAPTFAPQRHRLTTERVTCLRAPRAHLRPVAA